MPGGSDGCNQQISQIIPYFSGILSLLATILLPNAASMIWAARSSVPWIRWPYTLSVIVGELCPRRREIVRISRPALINMLAWVWRRLCMVAAGMPIAAMAGGQAFVMALGLRCPPSAVAKTGALSGVLLLLAPVQQ